MFVSMSRTIGYSIIPVVSANRGAGPMSIIWWTIGVSGIDAPAIRAISGLQTPHAITTVGVDVAAVVRTRRTRPSLDVDAQHLGVGRHRHPGLDAPARA